jgi:riboflavin transporter FmnP
MTILANLLSITSGFALTGYAGPMANLIATSIIVDLALAPLTAIVAARRGRSTTRWAIAGVALGAWALAAVMILPAYRPPSARPSAPQFPPTSDAA